MCSSLTVSSTKSEETLKPSGYSQLALTVALGDPRIPKTQVRFTVNDCTLPKSQSKGLITVQDF